MHNYNAMVKEKKDIRPAIVKVGVALVLSLAGLLYSHLRSKRAKFPQPPDSPCSSVHVEEFGAGGREEMKEMASSGIGESISVDKHEDMYRLKVAIDNPEEVVSPNSRQGGDKDGHLSPEFNYLADKFDFTPAHPDLSDCETSRAFRSEEKDDHDQEIRYLRATVRNLQEREKNLEFQLLEFYGLKEQENAVIELQNRLKVSNTEAKLFTLKIESLQAENQRLQEQLADHAKVASELDAATKKIKLLRKLLKSEAEQNKEQILTLQKRVNKLQEQEAAGTGSGMQLKLEKLKDLEAEVEDLRNSNSKLHLENSELTRKLESTQILATSVLEDPEMEALRKLSNQLRQENEELKKKIEQLQADRCADVEELVYLRWINACLRYELRNFQPEHGKAVARDLSRSLSSKSEEKAKQLILEYASTEGMGEKCINIMELDSDLWSSSRTSYVTHSGYFDDSPVSTKNSESSKLKIFNKLRRLIRGKDVQHQNQGSSADRAMVTEDYDSAGGSSAATDAGSEMPYNIAQRVCPDNTTLSFRHSADIQRTKNQESGRRNSDLGSSDRQRRAFSARITSSYLSSENQLDRRTCSSEKSELLKFAEVLKDTNHETRRAHRKSISLGSAMGFRLSTSE